MNIYKHLLFLHGYLTTAEFEDENERPHYGAATATRQFAPRLGNRATSARWFGREQRPAPTLTTADCVVGGCA